MTMLESALMHVVMNCGSSNAAVGDFSTCGQPSKNQPKPQPSGCCLDCSRNLRMKSGSSGERDRSATRAKRRHMIGNSHESVDNHDLKRSSDCASTGPY